ncbi:Hpt domain-containing protein [Hoeflea sp. AS60]|uniref:Hpt domain-containing protein n=1 Tax=Hoeflea sp. AS60 TaxID=3135780 RepID=UPI0031760C88
MSNQTAHATKLEQLPEAARDRIQQLRLLFIERSMEQLAQIRHLLDERAGAEDPRTMDADLIKLAHSMVGASGIFGFPGIGNAAFKLENILREAGYSEADFEQAADELIAELTMLG